MRKQKGFTLIELCIAIAIWGIIVGAIYTVTRQYQILGMRTINDQADLSQAIRAISIILTDFRSSSKTWLGSLQLNGDFETPVSNGGATPLGWPSFPPNPTNATVTYIQDATATNTHEGSRALALTATGVATYASTVTLTMKAGAVYMVSGWVRTGASTTYKLSLLNNLNTEVASVTGSSTTWSRLLFRYPASGSYVSGAVPADQVKLALGIVSGTAQTFFDDVAVTPINAVLLSSSAVVVNVSTAVASMSDPADPAGYRFARWENGKLAIYRYRISNDEKPYLIRETYDAATSLWKKAWAEKLTSNIESLVFTYSPSGALPLSGKESVLTVQFALKSDYAKNANFEGKTISFDVSPSSP